MKGTCKAKLCLTKSDDGKSDDKNIQYTNIQILFLFTYTHTMSIVPIFHCYSILYAMTKIHNNEAHFHVNTTEHVHVHITKRWPINTTHLLIHLKIDLEFNSLIYEHTHKQIG